MKYIEKRLENEPVSLKEKRSTPGATYDACNKDDIRLALLPEQGYLCAYCIRRISNERDELAQPLTTIEHYEAQSTDENLRMNFMNMLGVCRGGSDLPKHLQHCGQNRGNAPLKIDPRKKESEHWVLYETSGKVYSKDAQVNHDLQVTLNLNTPGLVKNRKKVLEAVRQATENRHKRKQSDLTASDFRKEIARWKSKTNGRFGEYCMVAIAYLERKLVRLP